MDSYRYKAMDPNGKIKTGRSDACNIADLELRLRKMELDLVRCRAIKRRGGAFAGLGARLAVRVVGGGVRRRDLILLCFHLEHTMKAGVPLLSSLRDLRDSAENPRLKEVVCGLIESIEGGKTLSSSMRDFPAVFPRLFADLIAAGERSGRLAATLGKLTDSLKFQDEQAAMTKKLLAYPLFLAAVLLGVLAFLMLYLVPELSAFVAAMERELPLHTRLLIAASETVGDYWWAPAVSLSLTICALSVAMSMSPAVALAVDRAKLRLPVLGPLLKKIILARLCGFFAMMYASGITIPECLRGGERIAANRAVAAALQDARRRIADGANLSAAFAAAGLFPPLVTRMIEVGESGGALEEALRNVCYFYTRDIKESTAGLQAMIEPAMTTALGVVIAWIMLSVLGPVYEIVSAIRL